jgi:hypothetical protein
MDYRKVSTEWRPLIAAHRNACSWIENLPAVQYVARLVYPEPTLYLKLTYYESYRAACRELDRTPPSKDLGQCLEHPNL